MLEGVTCKWPLYNKLKFLEPFVNLKKDHKIPEQKSSSSETTRPVRKAALDEHELISLIKQYPILYDKKHSDFRSSSHRQSAWEEIADRAQWDVDTLQKKWRVMRDRFVRELRRTQYISSGSLINSSSFFREMLFLATHVRSKYYEIEAGASEEQNNEDDEKVIETPDDDIEYNSDSTPEWQDLNQTEYQILEIEPEEETAHDEEVTFEEVNDAEYLEISDNDTRVAVIAEEAVSNETVKSGKRKCSSKGDEDEEIQDHPQKNQKLSESQQSSSFTKDAIDKDEDIAFGNTIGCMLKKIPQHLKTAVKLKLLTSLADFEAQHNLN